MEIIAEKVECFNRVNMPLEHETIADDFDLELIAPIVKEINVYHRPKEVCPFNRGNWIIDLRMIDDLVLALKLPSEMEKHNVIKFIQPLIDMLENKKIIIH